MKRIVILLPLLAGLVMPVFGFSTPSITKLSACEVSELPWSTVSAVLKKVEETHPYSYSSLVEWYQVGLVTVVQAANGAYEVRIYDEDGIVDVIIQDTF